ncbi:MAG: aminoglycoside phosphotransferase family protein [Alphaproteobacteria bacterium]
MAVSGWIDKKDCFSLAHVILYEIFDGEKKLNFTARESGNSVVFDVNDEWIVKIPTDKNEARAIRHEIKLAQKLKSADLPVEISHPTGVDIAWADSQGDAEQVTCAIMKKIKGSHVPFDIEPNHKLTRQVGEFLAALHAVKVSPDDVRECEWNWNVQKILKKMGPDISLRRYLKSTVFAPLYQAYISRVHPVLCHGDIHRQNVIVDSQGNLSAVIDFGNATLTCRGHEVVEPCFGASSFLTAYRQAAGVGLNDNFYKERHNATAIFNQMDLACMRQKHYWCAHTRD